MLCEISDLGALTFKDGDFRFGSSHLRSEISNPNIEEEKSRLRDLNEERSGLSCTDLRWRKRYMGAVVTVDEYPYIVFLSLHTLPYFPLAKDFDGCSI